MKWKIKSNTVCYNAKALQEATYANTLSSPDAFFPRARYLPELPGVYKPSSVA